MKPNYLKRDNKHGKATITAAVICPPNVVGKLLVHTSDRTLPTGSLNLFGK